ncbi:NAD(P)/FAD-dependent oxidoreductase [Sphingomonas baiyangensis]|uniref:FAD-binding oxidoreductase n=1 Tax=Sphingomonas baiyangensis TaxID=2572576 RepID=A0A4U1L3H4_9SPHN|nr:FAD-binding oxidoreductase [Sphingomonas baiyangensis]TKD50753.1 FAD-binding oxidoreductase [Sphingomonas baiyangensis]
MERADVAIIGGGLIGCAAAWRLAQRGARVVLLEAGEHNAGASGQNAGSLHFQLERRFLEQGEALAEQAARIATLNVLAVADWRAIECELGADLHVSMAGGLMVAETREEVALLEAKAAREAAAGLAVRLIDGDAARALAPYLAKSVIAACHLTDEGHADPRALTPALAAAARAAGAAIREGCRVEAIKTPAPGRFVLRTAAGGVTAAQLLIAAGAWSASVAAMANIHLPMVPVALQMNATERIAPAIPHLIQHVGRRLSLKQAHAGNVLIGGGWPARMAVRSDGGFDLARRPALSETSLAGNLRAAIDVVPMLARLNLIRTWTGTTAITADQLPIVGPVPRLPGLWVAGGGSAFTLGLTFARLIANAMGGERVRELDLFGPARFDHLNSFMGAA